MSSKLKNGNAPGSERNADAEVTKVARVQQKSKDEIELIRKFSDRIDAELEAFFAKIDEEVENFIEQKIENVDIRMSDGREITATFPKMFFPGNISGWNWNVIGAYDEIVAYVGSNGISKETTKLLEDRKTQALLIVSKYARFYVPLIEDFISGNETPKSRKGLTNDEKLDRLEAFARRNNGIGVKKYAKYLFPSLFEPQINSTANEAFSSEADELVIPKGQERELVADEVRRDRAESVAKWANRESGDTPVTFIRKHYGVWQGGVWSANGLTRAELRSDMQLYNALVAWERRHPEDQLGLPTHHRQKGSWVEFVGSDPETAQEANPSAEDRARQLEREARSIRRGIAKEK